MSVSRSTTAGLALMLPAAAVAAVIAGCGSSAKVAAGPSDSTAASTSAPATVTDTVVPPPSTTTATVTPTATGPVACATANLSVGIGSSEGAAGSLVYHLLFTNKGAAACTISGYPGVSYVAPGTGKQVGAAASRDSTTIPIPTITLLSGAVANAAVSAANYQNFPASSCAATAVSGFRVYPPGNKAAAYVTLPSGSKACSTAADLQVQPVQDGTGS